jgi:hypothetical protein
LVKNVIRYLKIYNFSKNRRRRALIRAKPGSKPRALPESLILRSKVLPNNFAEGGESLAKGQLEGKSLPDQNIKKPAASGFARVFDSGEARNKALPSANL